MRRDVLSFGIALLLYPATAGGQTGSDDIILFELNSFALSAKAKLRLGGLAARVANEGIRQVHVTGHADAVGEPEYNIWISMRRTQSVVDRLTHFGVPPGIIVADWRGEHDPVQDDGPDAKTPANRRVVISLKD